MGKSKKVGRPTFARRPPRGSDSHLLHDRLPERLQQEETGHCHKQRYTAYERERMEELDEALRTLGMPRRVGCQAGQFKAGDQRKDSQFVKWLFLASR